MTRAFVVAVVAVGLAWIAAIMAVRGLSRMQQDLDDTAPPAPHGALQCLNCPFSTDSLIAMALHVGKLDHRFYTRAPVPPKRP